MADEKWSGFDLETSTSGILVPVLFPDGASPSNYKNARIAIANFFLTLQNQIDDLDTDVIDHEDRIQVLEDGLTKTLNKNQNSAFTITQNADSKIFLFGFRYVSGTPVVKVGTAVGLEDIVDEATVSSEYSYDVSEYSLSSRTLHITITGGTVDVVTLSRGNLYEV